MSELNGVSGGTKPLLKTEESKEVTTEDVQKVPEPLENSNFCVMTLLLSVSSVMMSTGIAVGSLNTLLTTILPVYYNQTYQFRFGVPTTVDDTTMLLAFTVSMLLAGGFVGALSISFMLPLFSRKQSMIIMNLTNVVAVAVLTLGGWFGHSHEAIIVGRFIMGLYSGFGMNLIPIVVAESCTLAKQAFYLSLIGVNLSIGGVIGLCFGYEQVLGSAELWPALLAISAFPSVTYLAFSPFLLETPSYYVNTGERGRALSTLRKLRQKATEERLLLEIDKIENALKVAGSVKKVPLVEMFKFKNYRRQLFVVVMVFTQSQLCGVNAVGMYTNTIFCKAGFQGQSATMASTVVYVVQLVVACLGSLFIDRFGPKKLNLISGTVMSFSIILLTVAIAKVPTTGSCQGGTQQASSIANATAATETIPAMSYVSVFAVTLYILIWACGVNLTLFPMLAAFTTERTREAAFLFGGGIFWILSWFVGFIPNYLLKWLGPYAFLPFCFTNALFVVYVAIFIPETRKRSPDEIQLYIQTGRNELKKQNDDFMTSTI